jgi:hypothetical protein
MITLMLAALEQRAGWAGAEAEQLPGRCGSAWPGGIQRPAACWTGRRPRCAVSTGSREGTVLVWPPICCAPSGNRAITGCSARPYGAVQNEADRKYSAIRATCTRRGTHAPWSAKPHA